MIPTHAPRHGDNGGGQVGSGDHLQGLRRQGGGGGGHGGRDVEGLLGVLGPKGENVKVTVQGRLAPEEINMGERDTWTIKN